jgi:autotransporter translocation and assembly factor TamB
MVRRASHIVRKIVLGFVALVLVAVCVGLVLLKTEWAAGKIRDLIVEKLSEELDSEVTIGKLSLELFPTAVVLENVALRPRGSNELFGARRVEVRVRLLELLRKHVAIDRVAVDGADVSLDLLDGRITNLPRLRKREGPPSNWRFTLARAQLRRSSVRAVVRAGDPRRSGGLRRVVDVFARMGGRPPPKGPLSLLARAGDVAVDVWSLPGSAWGVELDAGSGSILSGGYTERVVRLRARALLEEDALQVEHLEVGLGESQLALLVKGTARDLPALLAGKKGEILAKVILAAPAPILARFSAGGAPVEGTLTVDADVAGSRPRDLVAHARVGWRGARVGKHHLGDIRVRVVASRAGLSFDDTQLQFAQGKIHASGKMSFAQNPEVTARLDVSELRLERLLEAIEVAPQGVDLVPAGTIEVRGRILTGGGRIRPDLTARALLDVKNLIVKRRRGTAPGHILAIPSIGVNANVRVAGDKVNIENTIVQLGGSRIRVVGEVRRGADVSLDVSSRGVRLEDVGTIAGFPWSGGGPVRASIRRHAGTVVVMGNFDIAGLSFSRVDLERVSGIVEYSNGTLHIPIGAAARGGTRFGFGASVNLRSESPAIDADVKILRGHTEDVLRIMRLPAYYGSYFSGDVSGTIHLEGTVKNPTGSGELRFTDAVARGEGIHEVIARGKYTGKAWEVDQVTVRKTATGGRLEVNGIVQMPQRELNLMVTTEGLSLEDFSTPMIKRAGLAGNVTLLADLHGTLDNPQGNGTLTIRKTKVYGLEQQDSQMAVRVNGRRLSVSGNMLGKDVSLQGSLTFSKALDFKGSVDLKEFEFSSLVKGEARNFFGKATGHGEFQGQATKLSSITAKLTLPQVVVDVGGAYTAKNKAPVVVSLRAGEVNVQSFAVEGGPDRDLNLNVRNRVGLDGSLNLRVDGTANLRILKYLVKDFQAPEGLVTLTAQVEGTFRDPLINGYGRVSGVKLSTASFPYELSHLGARLRFSENRVLIEDLAGDFSDGHIRGEGFITLSRFMPQDFTLHTTTDETGLTLFDGDVQVRFASDLRLSGNMDRMKLDGTVRLARARYSKDMEWADLLLKKKRVVPKSFQKGKDRLYFDVKLVAPDDIRISNNRADLEFGGEVEFRGTLREPNAVGQLRLVRPGSFNDGKNTYKTDRGYVVFKEGVDPRRPYIDIEGVTRVRLYDITLLLKGNYPDLQLDWSCGAGLAREDCVALSRTGLTFKELNTVRPADRNTAGLSAALDTLGAVTGFDAKVAEAVPIFDTFRIGSGYSEYSSTIVPLLTVGKQVIPNYVTVYGTTSLADPSRDYKAQVELNLARNLALTGEYAPIPRTGVTSAGVGQSLGNLGIDLRWRFEF